MASLKYTRNDVLTMCKNLGLTITTEDALGCVAKKDNVIYRFEYITKPVKPKKPVESVVEEETPPATLSEKSRKTKATEETETEPIVVEEKKPSKRRGRPRKIKVVEETTAESVIEVSENGVTVTPKKRRGRRTKAEIAAAKAAEAEAKKSKTKK